MPEIMKGLFECLEVEWVRGWVLSPVNPTLGQNTGRTWDDRGKALRTKVGWDGGFFSKTDGHSPSCMDCVELSVLGGGHKEAG